MSKAEEKTTELIKKAKDFIPDGGYSEKELNLAFFMFIKGYHQAEKDLELTLEDMRELYIIFAEVDTEIELCKTDIKAETIGYYLKVLKRFKKRKEK